MSLAPLPPSADRQASPPPVELDTLLPHGMDALATIERLLRELVRALPGPDPSPWLVPRGRPPVMPVALVWSALLYGVLHRLGSVHAIWRRLSAYGVWDAPAVTVSDQALYHRLGRASAEPMRQLCQTLTAALATRPDAPTVADPASFATGVYALDTTTLDALARRLDWLRDLPPRDRRRLPGKLGGLFDVRQQCWVRLERITDADENDKVTARLLVHTLRPWSLVLFDLGYFSFAWLDDLTAAQLWYVTRLRAKTSYTIIHTFYQDDHETFDGLVWLGGHRADRARHAVRLVQFRHGNRLHQYLTNVRDPDALPLADVARLYARRWDIEMAVQLVKQHLDLRLFWSSQPSIVEQQLWAVLTIAQCWQAIRLEVAAALGVDPFDVSLPLLVRDGLTIAQLDTDLVAFLRDHGRRLGFIRPSRRLEIRAPTIDPATIVPRPVGLTLTRSPRYARRRCD